MTPRFFFNPGASAIANLNWANVAATLLGIRIGGTDYPIISTDGFGDVYFGSLTFPGEIGIRTGAAGDIVFDANGNIFSVATTFSFMNGPLAMDVVAVPAPRAYGQLFGYINSQAGSGHTLAIESVAGMVTTLGPGGDARAGIDRGAVKLAAVAGAGTAAAHYTIPTGACCEVLVTVLGVAGAGASGFRTTATSTVKNHAGTAAFVTNATGSTNPTVNPLLDLASDAAFNGGGGPAAPSTVTLSVSGADLVATVHNANAAANDFMVFFEVKSFT